MAQRLALRLVLPVAHVLQEVYEVLGFLGQRVIWPNTASLMLPRDGFEDGRLGPFVFSRIIVYIKHGSLLFQLALYSFCSLFYPFYLQAIIVSIAGLRGVKKRGCEVLQFTV